jgi:hypothetical protein
VGRPQLLWLYQGRCSQYQQALEQQYENDCSGEPFGTMHSRPFLQEFEPDYFAIDCGRVDIKSSSALSFDLEKTTS